MWFSNKKKDTPKKETPTPKEEQKPESYNAVMEMVLINNKTDKEYVLKSQNDFGLKWEYVKDRSDNERNDILCIQQKDNIDGTAWSAKGRYYDFSILSMVHKIFLITGESWYGKVVCLKDDVTEEQIKEMYGYENFSIQKASNYTVMEDRGRIIKIAKDWFPKRIFDIKQ